VPARHLLLVVLVFVLAATTARAVHAGARAASGQGAGPKLPSPVEPLPAAAWD
jgi:hypothetical protein